MASRTVTYIELHSPTLTSTKWWIGALGKTATHGVVQAKLILPGGKDVGPHLFLVQLRSLGLFSICDFFHILSYRLEDHCLCSGITAGDVGPTAGGGNGCIHVVVQINGQLLPRITFIGQWIC